MSVQAATLNGQGGTLASNGTLALSGGTLNLRNGTTTGKAITVDADALTTAGGELTAYGEGPLSLTVRGALDNTAGKIITNGALQLAAGSLSNASAGSIAAAGTGATQITVAQRLDNTGGTLAAMGVTTVHAGDLINQGGTVSQKGSSSASQAANGAALTVTADGLLDNSARGVLASDGNLVVNAATLDNTQGTIAQGNGDTAGQGALTIHAATLHGQGGTLASNGALMLTGGDLDLRDGTTYAQAVTVNANALTTAGGHLSAIGQGPLVLTVRDALDNTAGTIDTNGALLLNAGSLSNASGGYLTAAGTGATQVKVAQRFDNTGGHLAAMGATTVQAGNLINQGGQIQAANGATLTVAADGLLDNSANGLLASDGDLTISAATLDNTNGTIQGAGQGALTVNAATLNGQGGTLASNGALILNGGALNLRDGTTYAQAITVNADALTTAGGQLTALGAGPLTLSVRHALDNTAGTIQTNGALLLNAGSLSNAAGGQLTAAGTDASQVAVVHRFDNTGGTLNAMGATTVHAGDLINQGGKVLAASGSPLTVSVDGLLDNSANGELASDGDLSIHAATLDNTQGQINQAGEGTLTIDAANLRGANGSIASNGVLIITGDTTDLSGGTTTAQTVSITTGTLSTAGGHLNAIGGDPLQLTVRGGFDNTGGTVITNGALALSAGSVINTDGKLVSAGTEPTTVRVAGTLDNTRGLLASAGATTLQAGNLINTAGTIQAANAAPLSLTVDGLLSNEQGSLLSNGDIVLAAGSLGNQGGTIQTTQTLSATVADTLDNSGGALNAGGNLTVQSGALINRSTRHDDASAPPTGLYGQQVTLRAATFDNTQGQVVARDALDIAGGSLINAGGVLDGQGTVSMTGDTFDNAGGKLIQRGDTGTLTVAIREGLNNTAYGSIGAEGNVQLRAGQLDNSGGTIFAYRDLALTSDGDLLNRGNGLLSQGGTSSASQSSGSLSLTTGGSFDNSGGTLDAGGAAVVTASTLVNQGGQVLAGAASAPDAALQLAIDVIDNRGGTIGNRGGDVVITRSAVIDNGAGGSLVAQRDLILDAVTALDNTGGKAYAARHLSYQNGAGTLDNTGGTLGAGDTAWLNLGAITNTQGLLQADTLWLTTPTLSNTGGTVSGNTVHATFATLDGLGTLYGTQTLDIHALGDYTHLAGQQFNSDGVLSLSVDGTLTNQGSLTTAGELNVTAANLINQGAINASADDGSASAHITAADRIDNQAGASMAGDTLTLSAVDITNTSSQGITGDTVRIDADTLTNGRDLGTANAAVAYGEGFIGASQSLDLRVAQYLANLDGDIYSGGYLTIAGRANGTRLATLDNVSGRIQAGGNGNIAADTITNRRRFIETEQYSLSPAEQDALSSERAYDNALTPAERQRMDQLFRLNGSPGFTAADRAELLSYLHRIGYTHVDHVDNATLAAMNASINQQEIDRYGHRAAYIVPQASGNPAGEFKQFDSFQTGTRLVRESADSQITTGGDLNIDLGTHLTNFASTIAATGNLSIGGQAYDGSTPDTRIDNIAVVGQYTGTRETDVLSMSALAIRYQDASGWHDAHSDFNTVLSTDPLTVAGPVLAGATITGKNVAITGRDVTNTAVAVGSGITAIGTDGLNGPGNTALGDASLVTAGGASGVDGATGTAVGGTGSVDHAQDQTVGAATGAQGVDNRTVQGGSGINAATGSRVHGPDDAHGTAAQMVGSADQPLPGFVPPNNGMYGQNTDPSAPFLVTTAPRFAKGASTSSDYLLRSLGQDPGNIHKRLGDGYYEQNLVMDQVLRLTGRRTLNGGDGLAQYQALMDGAAAEAGRLGLQLGAPLTTAQIGALDSDIVWLVDQVVNGQHVLVPVVYLSKATADRMKSDGALIAGDNVNIKASGIVNNDGTITGTQGTTISADTLINQGALSGGNRLAIATRGDTINTGTLSGNAIGITAGGSVVNAPSVDGLMKHGGVIAAGTGGLQIAAANDVINGGKISSQGNALIVAGRDVVQTTTGSLTAVGNAAVVAGRDAVFDQSTLTAGKVAYVEAGRDAVFNAATVSGGTGIGVVAGRDIVGSAVVDHVDTAAYSYQGKTNTATTYATDTTRGSTFTSGGDLTMQAGRDISLTATTVNADGAVGLSAGRDINLLAGQNTHSESVDTRTTKKGTFSKKETTTHDATDDTTAVGTTISGKEGIALDAGRNVLGVGTTLQSSDGGIAITAGDQVALLAALDTHTTEHSEKTRRSGLGYALSQDSGTKKKTTVTQDGTVVGSTLDAAGPIVVASGGDQTYQAANIKSDTGTALVSGGAINFVTATESESYTRDSSKHNAYYQANDHRDRLDTTEVQTSITGPVTMAAADGVNIAVGRKKGETQDDAIARASQQRDGTAWIGDAKNQSNVNFQSVDEQHVDEHQHHEGLTSAAATVVTVAAVAATAGAASAAVGSTLGAGGGTFAAGTAATATTAATAAGVGNVIATGALTGALGGAVNAGVQGYDIGRGAWKGFYTGAASAGLFYGAGEIGAAKGWLNGDVGKIGLHMAAGGVNNVIAGGDFFSGAISAGFAEGIGPYMKGLPGGGFGQAIGHAAAGAAGSWLSGGDAGQGALNGLSGYLFNEQLHPDAVRYLDKQAENYAREQCGCDPSGPQIDMARNTLIQTAYRMTDEQYDQMAAIQGKVFDETAARYIGTHPLGGAVDGEPVSYFAPEDAQRRDPSVNAYNLYNDKQALAWVQQATALEGHPMFFSLAVTDYHNHPQWANQYADYVVNQTGRGMVSTFTPFGFTMTAYDQVQAGDYWGAAKTVGTTGVMYGAGAGAGKLAGTLFGLSGMTGQIATKGAEIGGAALAGGTINASAQYLQDPNHDINNIRVPDMIGSMIAGGAGSQMKFFGNVAVNGITGAAAAYADNVFYGDDKNIVVYGVTSVGTSAIGYGVGDKLSVVIKRKTDVQWSLNNPDYLPSGPILVPGPKNPLPTAGAIFGGATSQEAVNWLLSPPAAKVETSKGSKEGSR